jgi:flagellar motility protein MotE (MotC chaperone)
MIKLLQSPWAAALIGGLSYVLTTIALWRPPPLPEKALTNPATAAQMGGPSWSFRNPEVDDLIRELRGEKGALKAQQASLEEWAARLQAERAELNVLTQQVQQMQTELDQTIIRLKAEEQENLKRLAKIYAGMSPEGAANILQELADEPLAKILVTMKESEAAPVLELLAKEPGQAKRVALLTERLRFATAHSSGASKAATK